MSKMASGWRPNQAVNSTTSVHFITGKIKKIGVNPLYPCHPRFINPPTDLKAALDPRLPTE
jgi:hypothetical protein